MIKGVSCFITFALIEPVALELPRGNRQVSLEDLTALVERYGRWAIERARQDAKDQKAKLTEASRRYKAVIFANGFASTVTSR